MLLSDILLDIAQDVRREALIGPDADSLFLTANRISAAALQLADMERREDQDGPAPGSDPADVLAVESPLDQLVNAVRAVERRGTAS
ncbi:hypothetical protein [Roseospira visakhapatnamensis]|uniref:Uncharacterized protein n=1 Tax=Roseospira visakhapatnamensis TaxID=390880 RepID=A0A7W6WC13_9PROT|nr:hypothetical protein [Roseospira visakhapatnamensis]MBB4268127.1 hypothetical protein [Roseospira visakhapatnamensis]